MDGPLPSSMVLPSFLAGWGVGGAGVQGCIFQGCIFLHKLNNSNIHPCYNTSLWAAPLLDGLATSTATRGWCCQHCSGIFLGFFCFTVEVWSIRAFKISHQHEKYQISLQYWTLDDGRQQQLAFFVITAPSERVIQDSAAQKHPKGISNLVGQIHNGLSKRG